MGLTKIFVKLRCQINKLIKLFFVFQETTKSSIVKSRISGLGIYFYFIFDFISYFSKF